MRALLAAAAMVALSQGAWAQGISKTDPFLRAPEEDSTAPDTDVVGRLQEFGKNLEEAGFKDIQVISGGLIIRAKDKFDKPIVLLINPDTMVAFQLPIQPAPETTGSGSSEEKKD